MSMMTRKRTRQAEGTAVAVIGNGHDAVQMVFGNRDVLGTLIAERHLSLRDIAALSQTCRRSRAIFEGNRDALLGREMHARYNGDLFRMIRCAARQGSLKCVEHVARCLSHAEFVHGMSSAALTAALRSKTDIVKHALTMLSPTMEDATTNDDDEHNARRARIIARRLVVRGVHPVIATQRRPTFARRQWGEFLNDVLVNALISKCDATIRFIRYGIGLDAGRSLWPLAVTKAAVVAQSHGLYEWAEEFRRFSPVLSNDKQFHVQALFSAENIDVFKRCYDRLGAYSLAGDELFFRMCTNGRIELLKEVSTTYPIYPDWEVVHGRLVDELRSQSRKAHNPTKRNKYNEKLQHDVRKCAQWVAQLARAQFQKRRAESPGSIPHDAHPVITDTGVPLTGEFTVVSGHFMQYHV